MIPVDRAEVGFCSYGDFQPAFSEEKFEKVDATSNRAEVFIWQKFQPTYRSRLDKPRSRQPSQPTLSNERVGFLKKDLKVRRDLGNRAHVKRP